uniref:HORMA domain-containing protein n=1 Tax=Heterorhabditis bacteriophora TaxID=37862 RepID=A0A1I7X6E6_HETBA
MEYKTQKVQIWLQGKKIRAIEDFLTPKSTTAVGSFI